MKAVIMAGGEGKRLRPITCTTPKAMMTLLGKPIIDYILDLLEESDFSEVYITLGYLSDVIRNHVYSQNRKIKINYITESEALGTAGSVKNAIKKSDEPFLVISGDTLCDYRLDRIMEYHNANSCDMTVVTTKVCNPSEYGVVSAEPDCRIKRFIENPSFTQAVSNNANTGIYVLSPNCLDVIPENIASDFSKDVLPEMLKEKMRVFQYPAEGYWCDINDFSSYTRCQCDMLDGKANIKIARTYKNIITESDSNIKILPPSYIGKNVVVGKNVVIGPYSVIGDGCKIDDNAKIHGAIIGKENYIGRTVKINSAVTGDNCSFLKNVSIFENAVAGDRVKVGADSILCSDVKIWPNKNICGGTAVSENIKYTSSKRSTLDAADISGTGGVEVTPEKCSLIGAAVGSTLYGRKVGIACDGKPLSRAMLMCVAGGLMSVGSRVWSFDDALIPQLYFYTSYCSLTSGIYVSSKNDDITVHLFSQSGLSIPCTVRREIERRIIDRSFAACGGKECKNIADMSGVGLMYQRELLNQCPDGLTGMNVKINCKNEKIMMLLTDSIHRLGGKDGDSIILNISDDGTSLSASDSSSEVLGNETLLAICCMFEVMSGNDIAVPFDAPAVIDVVAEKYSRKAYRYLSSPSARESDSVVEIAKKQLWARDSLFMCLKLLNAVHTTGMTLSELKSCLPKYSTVNKTVDFSSPLYELYKIFSEFSPILGSDGEGVEIRLDNSRAVIIPRKSMNTLRIIAESVSQESAESLCDDIFERIQRFENAEKIDKRAEK